LSSVLANERGLEGQSAPKYGAAMARRCASLLEWSVRSALKPEAWTLSLCLAAWIYMYLRDQIGFGPLGIICASSIRAAPDGAELSGQSPLLLLSKGGPVVCAVTAAVMMTPLAIGPARRLAVASKRDAWRALPAFLMGYTGVWFFAGALVGLVISAIATGALAGVAAAEFAYLAALAWELTPAKRRALDACRKDAAAKRSAVDLSHGEALGCGARHGLNCLLSCGVMMFATAFVEQGHWTAMITVLAICILQRSWLKFARPIGVLGLAGLALGCAAGGLWVIG
jgi:Predicted metal-binding integral membrane protein (DUF2182)